MPENLLYKFWGKNLKNYRQACNLTQEQAAEKLDTTDATISRWEAGLVMPNDEMKLRVAELYGVQAFAIFPLVRMS